MPGRNTTFSNPWGHVLIISAPDADGKTKMTNLTPLVIDARITLKRNSLHDWSITFINPKNSMMSGSNRIRKMDKVIIMGGRGPHESNQIITGYVDTDPWDTNYPGDPITIGGYCTLFKSAIRNWDPKLPIYQQMAYATPDVILRYIATDPALGGFADGDVIIEPIDKGVVNRWKFAMHSALQLSTGTPTSTSDYEYDDKSIDFSSGGNLSSAKVKGKEITKDQMKNANIILSVGRQMAANRKCMISSIMTSIQESKLLNIDHGLSDSLGLFQQRPSQGWGSAQEVTDPVHASTKYFESCIKYDKKYPNVKLTELCQGVQISGYPEAYAEWENEARNIYNLWSNLSDDTTINPNSDKSSDTNVLTVPENRNIVLAVMSHKGLTYDYGVGGKVQKNIEDTKYQIDGRIWATLWWLLNKYGTINISDVNALTHSSNSDHYANRAVDINRMGDGKGGIIDWNHPQKYNGPHGKIVKEVLTIKGAMAPTQVITDMSPSNFNNPRYITAPNHDTHIHIGFGQSSAFVDPKDSTVINAMLAGNDVLASLIDGTNASDTPKVDVNDYNIDDWEVDEYKVKYERLDDTQSVLGYMNSVANWGMYDLQTRGDGKLVAMVSDYLGNHNYKISDMDIINYNPSSWSIKDLPTHVYVHGQPSVWDSIDYREQWNSLIGASTWYDDNNMLMLYNDDLFIPYRAKMDEIFKKRKKKDASLFGTIAEAFDFRTSQEKIQSISVDDDWVKLIDSIIDRYGARPIIKEEPLLKHFWQAQLQADYEFRKHWYNRYKASLSCTFLPDIRPMFRVLVESKDKVFFVESVTHTMFSSWTTQINATYGRPPIMPKMGGEDNASRPSS